MVHLRLLRVLRRSAAAKVTALIAVLFALVLGNVVGNVLLDAREADGAIINEGGRLRMLSQRTPKAAFDYALGNGAAREEMLASHEALRAGIHVVRRGDAARGIPPAPPEIAAQYDRAIAAWQEVDAAAAVVASEPPGTAAFERALSALGTGSQRLLGELEVAVHMFEAEATAKTQAMNVWVLIELVCSTVACGLAIWWLRRVVRPLGELESAARAIAAGAEDVVVDVDGEDEVGRLAAEFNTMTATLQRVRLEAERMARLKAALLANMSHEIRTPLSVIIGYAEALEAEVPDDLQELVAPISYGGRRLLSTLNDVLDLAQIEAGQMNPRPEPLDLAAYARDAARDVSSLARSKGVALTVDAPDSLPVVLLDPRLLDRIVCNLLGNAVKFTERGRVELQVRYAPDTDGGQRLGAGRVSIEVEDTGIGISPEALPHLFEEFQQGSEGDARTHEGNGLGLALVRRVTELMGGAVAVESALGEGSRFRVSLPAAVAA